MKKVLITQNQLVNLAGSEITTLELCSQFIDFDWSATVYTNVYDDPAKKEFDKLNIDVVTDAEKLAVDSYDLIWVHHQVLPDELIEFCKDPSKLPLLIFHHMSSLEPIEHIFLGRIEASFADLSTYNAPRTKDVLIDQGIDTSRMSALQNPVGDDFFNYDLVDKPSENLENILIVSNHCPDEVVDAMNILKEEGVNYKHIGEGGVIERVTPNSFEGFDAVITIGKTVQYAIILGIPVYCYDHWGGPGYLTLNNFEKAYYHNFSGRGFFEKNSKDIASELKSGYKEALKESRVINQKYANNFKLSSTLVQILDTAKSNKVNKKVDGLTKIEVESAIKTLEVVKRYYEHSFNLQKIREELDGHIANLRSDIESFVQSNRDLWAENTSLKQSNEELLSVVNKPLVRIGVVIDRFLSKIPTLYKATNKVLIAAIKAGKRIRRNKNQS